MFISQVGNSVSVSGGYGGATGSVSVDVTKFEESEETKKEFGENNSLTRLVEMIFQSQFRRCLWASKKHCKRSFGAI